MHQPNGLQTIESCAAIPTRSQGSKSGSTSTANTRQFGPTSRERNLHRPMPTRLSACPTNSQSTSAPTPAKVTSRSPPAPQRAPPCSRFFLGTCYCLISCVKNFRIQYMYIAVASIDNPLPRANRYLPELCIKIKTELTTNYTIPFQPIWIWVFKIHSLQVRLIVKSFNSLWFSSIKGHHLPSINGISTPGACVQRQFGRWAVVASLAVTVR